MTPGSIPQSHLPSVTVVIPAYNYGHFIGQALESVRAQTYQNWECIVIDDGSTDNTRDVVTGYAEKDRRIKYVYQKNQGLGASRNTGIRNGAGTYFQFLDADDLIEPRKLEYQAAYLEQHPEVDIVYGDARFFSTENMEARLYSMWEEDKPWMPQVSGKGREVLMALIRANMMVVNAPLIRRGVIESVGFFDGRVKGVEDWDYWIRCAVQGKQFHYQDWKGTLALVRSHPSSMSKDRREMIKRGLLVRKKAERIITEVDILKLNRARTAEDEALLGLEEVKSGSRFRGTYRFSKAGIIGRNLTWIICAFLSPFVAQRELGLLIWSSSRQCMARIKQKLKSEIWSLVR